jgi:hypothetical protein
VGHRRFDRIDTVNRVECADLANEMLIWANFKWKDSFHLELTFDFKDTRPIS